MFCFFEVKFNRSAETEINSFDKLYSKIGYVLDNYGLKIDSERTGWDYGITGLITVPIDMSKEQFDRVYRDLQRFQDDNRVQSVLGVVVPDDCPIADSESLFPRSEQSVRNMNTIAIDHSELEGVQDCLVELEYALGRQNEEVNISVILRSVEKIRDILHITENTVDNWDYGGDWSEKEVFE